MHAADTNQTITAPIIHTELILVPFPASMACAASLDQQERRGNGSYGVEDERAKKVP